MKKLISLCLALAMLAVLFSAAAYADADKDDAVIFTLSADKTDNLQIGDTFTITITAPGVQMASVDGYLRYKTDYFSYVGATYADNFFGAYNTSEGVKQFRLTGAFLASPFPTLGEVAHITLKVVGLPNDGLGGYTDITFGDATYSVNDQTLIPVTAEALHLPVGFSENHEHRTLASLHSFRIDATCTAVGQREYWKCMICEKLFADAELTEELTSTVAPMIPHTMVHHERIEPTTKKDGRVEYWQCSVCKSFFLTESGLYDDGSSSIVDEDDTFIDPLDPDQVDKTIMYGDVNGDGKITARDLQAMRKFFADREGSPLQAPDNADVNADGKLTARDLQLFRKYFADREGNPLGPKS